MGEGSVLQKLGTVPLQSTDAATNAVDTAMPRTGEIPHGLEVGFKQVILLTGEIVQPLPTAEPEVLRDHQQPGETGAKWGPAVQGEDHPTSKEALTVIPGTLLQVAIDLSLLLPQAAEALTEDLLGLLKGVAVVVVLAGVGSQRGNQNVRRQPCLLLPLLLPLLIYSPFLLLSPFRLKNLP